jgi:molybdopterin synthase catalytic subunit
MEMLTEHPINPGSLHALIAKRSSGAVVFHYAVVKGQQNQDKATIGIEYRTAGDSVAEMQDIAADLKCRWEIEDVLVVRRVGTLLLSDIICLIAVSSPNSADAFACCQYGIGSLKQMSTIRKSEIYG